VIWFLRWLEQQFFELLGLFALSSQFRKNLRFSVIILIYLVSILKGLITKISTILSYFRIFQLRAILLFLLLWLLLLLLILLWWFLGLFLLGLVTSRESVWMLLLRRREDFFMLVLLLLCLVFLWFLFCLLFLLLLLWFELLLLLWLFSLCIQGIRLTVMLNCCLTLFWITLSEPYRARWLSWFGWCNSLFNSSLWLIQLHICILQVIYSLLLYRFRIYCLQCIT